MVVLIAMAVVTLFDVPVAHFTCTGMFRYSVTNCSK